MDTEQNKRYDFTKFIEESFESIDEEIVMRLRSTDNEYVELGQEVHVLAEKFPIFREVLDGTGAVSMTAEEHDAFEQYLIMRHTMDGKVLMQAYFQGHADCHSYLKRIGVIQ